MSIANSIEPNVEILFQGQHILTVGRSVPKVLLVVETIICLSKHVRTSKFTSTLISANTNVFGLYICAILAGFPMCFDIVNISLKMTYIQNAYTNMKHISIHLSTVQTFGKCY